MITGLAVVDAQHLFGVVQRTRPQSLGMERVRDATSSFGEPANSPLSGRRAVE